MDERDALTPRLSLYEQALRLESTDLDRPPRTTAEVPAGDRGKRPRRTWQESRAAAREVLEALLTEPDTARAAEETERRLRELRVRIGHISAAAREMDVPDEARARALGRHLTRTGSTAYAVGTGIALLTRLGETEDVPCLKTLGLLPAFTDAAIAALDAIDSRAAALLWLDRRTRNDELRPLIDALTGGDDEAARARLITVPMDRRTVGSTIARRIAQSIRLPDLLREEPVVSGIVAQGARLLARMGSLRHYEPEILNYPEAADAFEAVIAHAHRLAPSLDHYATLLSLALDLHSGPAVQLDWRAGGREELLGALGSLLTAPDWAAVLAAPEPAHATERRRLRWLRRNAPRPFTAVPGSSRLRIEVVERDPAEPDVVETRFLVDGRPLVPRAFGRGPGHSPEYLLDNGSLRATADAQEVQLAEAYCTEGCCGALYVTVRREGDEVVWGGWRGAAAGVALTEYRFDAAAYDAEIARAETDHSWSWPARDTARLIAEGVRERPDLLTGWDAAKGWIGTDFDDPDITVLSFVFRPGLAAGRKDKDEPWLQFVWRLPDDGTPPGERAAAALRRLAAEDPKGYAELIGGSREYAEALGFVWPERKRRRT
ncbi:hypothetical protein [Streptomyces xantholiticus]|uniref:hypothetical protein n=1 Tax=Streptomyces xantholiticus TaxID=68285 RepID=UPI001679200B|nr:hypothetical protein [Streptomyces xantholiticus]GGW46566.1 hypothetical protein GCM10010381_34660 [Streptomyces xantholiticus]